MHILHRRVIEWKKTKYLYAIYQLYNFWDSLFENGKWLNIMMIRLFMRLVFLCLDVFLLFWHINRTVCWFFTRQCDNALILRWLQYKSTYYNGDQLSKTPLQKKKTFHILKVCIIRGKSHGAMMMMTSSPQAHPKFYKRKNKVLRHAYLVPTYHY